MPAFELPPSILTAPGAELSQDTLSAILSLAASGGPAPPKAKPPLPTPIVSPAKALPGAVRVALWDEAAQRKITGADAPTEAGLAQFLADNPRCTLFCGQTPAPVAEPTGLDSICKAALDEDLQKPGVEGVDKVDDDAVKEGKKNYTHFTPEQVARLSEEFAKTEHPSAEARDGLAKELGLTARSVQVWFQNRRQRSSRNLTKPASKPRPLLINQASPTSAFDHLAMVSTLAASHTVEKPKPKPAPPPSFQWVVLAGTSPKEGSSAKLMQKQRLELTDAQHKALVASYEISKFPSTAARQQLADQLGVPPRSVQTWFQNRRQRDPNREQKPTTPPPPARLSIDDALPLFKEAPRPAAAPAGGAHLAMLAPPAAPTRPPLEPHRSQPPAPKHVMSSALKKGGRPAQDAGLMWRPMTKLPGAPAGAPIAPAVRVAPTAAAPKRPKEAGLLMLLSCGQTEPGAKRQRVAVA